MFPLGDYICLNFADRFHHDLANTNVLSRCQSALLYCYLSMPLYQGYRGWQVSWKFKKKKKRAIWGMAIWQINKDPMHRFLAGLPLLGRWKIFIH